VAHGGGEGRCLRRGVGAERGESRCGGGEEFLPTGGGTEGCRWGSGDVADAWRERGTSRGVLADRRARATCTMRALLAEQRGRGEADGWAAATVSGDGVADERGPSGSRRGREGRGADRRDQPVSGRGWRRDRGRRRARMGRPVKERVGRAQMNSRISDLFKLVFKQVQTNLIIRWTYQAPKIPIKIWIERA
jgi:hypothetical protein